MKPIFLICTIFVAVAVATGGEKAEQCKEDDCKISSNCRCSNAVSPIAPGELDDYPQLISLTFDEAVTADIVKDYWEPLLYSRSNPDDQPIGATFFVPHEYTDYTKVNELYNYGFEIGVHSITKNPLQIYWRTATEELLQKEFGGQKTIISKFANIPTEDIIGVRTPQLQLAGNYSFTAFVNSELSYDSSWPTLPNKRMFPYTLDYRSTQDCTLGSTCPNEAFPGFWVLPINDLNGAEKECNVLQSCEVNGTADVIADWLYEEIDNIRTTTKVPITLLVTSSWFEFTENTWEALNDVLDRLSELKDVYFVAQKQVLDWMKNPVKTKEFKTDFPDNSASCNAVTCNLKDESGKSKYMRSCVSCPSEYPWLDNPTGN